MSTSANIDSTSNISSVMKVNTLPQNLNQVQSQNIAVNANQNLPPVSSVGQTTNPNQAFMFHFYLILFIFFFCQYFFIKIAVAATDEFIAFTGPSISSESNDVKTNCPTTSLFILFFYYYFRLIQ
jgi:hypothetical protein